MALFHDEVGRAADYVMVTAVLCLQHFRGSKPHPPRSRPHSKSTWSWECPTNTRHMHSSPMMTL